MSVIKDMIKLYTGHELVAIEKNYNNSYTSLKKHLQDVMSEGDNTIKFINACIAKDRKIKVIGYLGAAYLNDEIKIMMTNTLRKDLESEDSELALEYIANSNFFYEVKIHNENKKALICNYKLTGLITDVNLVGYNEDLFFLKLQFIIDYILDRVSKKSFSNSKECKCLYQCEVSGKSNSYSDVDLKINDVQKDFLCSLYNQVKDKYVKLKLVQVYKLIKRKLPLDYDVTNSLYLSHNIDIALSVEICGLVNTIRTESFIYKLLESRGNYFISGLKLARKYKIFSELAIDKSVREMSNKKYKEKELRKKEIIENIKNNLNVKVNNFEHKFNMVQSFKPSKNLLKVEELDDYQKTIIEFLEKNNYHEILNRKDPNDEKWIPIIIKIFYITKKIKIILDNPIIIYFIDIKKHLSDKKIDKLLELSIEKFKEKNTEKVITDLFSNKVGYIEIILQLSNKFPTDNFIEKSVKILSNHNMPSFYTKNSLQYITAYRLCNFCISVENLEKNRNIIEDIVLKKYSNNMISKMLLEIHMLFNLILPIKSIWIPSLSNHNKYFVESTIGRFVKYFEEGDFIKFLDKVKTNQQEFEINGNICVKKNNYIILENQVYLPAKKL